MAQVNGHATTAEKLGVKTSGLSKSQLRKLKAKTKKSTTTASTSTPSSDIPPLEPGTTLNGHSDIIKQEDHAPVASTSERMAAPAPARRQRAVELMGHIEQADDVKPEQLGGDPALADEFKNVFARFEAGPETKDEEGEYPVGKGEIIYSDDDDVSDDGDGETPKVLSKRKQRKLARLSVAELKRLVKRPEVVEWADVTANDPNMLVQLKSYRNAIPVPAHWSAKSAYLQGKKGIEKAPFMLPSFIADTGIATQRDAIKEKESNQSLKQKQRERVQPKMGKIDIDYQKLHDAFFRYQTKPPMTNFGEVYYEGKEFETKLREKRPGDLSDELKDALSIPPLAPPPWLISMQRFGPPASYPSLKIPGLNAPIPDGAQWGFHPGGWGKPPTDEYNRPLYGDVYGPAAQAGDAYEAVIDKSLWGEMEPEEEESDVEEEEEADEADDQQSAPADGLQTPSGLETPSGFASVASTIPGGLETPDFIELRKQRDTTAATDDGQPRNLYQVVPEQQASVRGFLGSDRTYDVRGFVGDAPVLGQEDRQSKRKAGGVDVAIDPAQLEGMSEAELRQQYEASRRGSGGQGGREDFGSFVAEEAAKRRKRDEAKRGGSSGRDRDRFKF
ncbi:uncharacterized protein L969DRAFT_85406 [Mixia osmundae IAM 14324]|uniref:PSP proline-rich domain-containing protein n=1 Tax=Mixia osmundae (strain CBS 9802 / IAM 14324 / JCM 22182 / KY 12970) TaxID=764103 RepID=G7DYP4_MIXOS|nr:uncharacterized protein L969DRAFT_85406 [Mixia osmundae IAM 14324]KEI41603.1 hypothetical protein L969DRAFT_85406 [Mixia osmundae IAM 14324]GAA95704.1 hypothetical protein E5Q_02361 [Mixia osmundae IAM 14324]